LAWLSAQAAMMFSSVTWLHSWIERALGALFIYLGIRLFILERV
jgi:threonine/homoserine/homoserine lactone efflux protein